VPPDPISDLSRRLLLREPDSDLFPLLLAQKPPRRRHRPPRPNPASRPHPHRARVRAHSSRQGGILDHRPADASRPEHLTHPSRDRPPATNPHRNIPESSGLLQRPREPKSHFSALIKVAALVRTPALNHGYEYGIDLRGALDVERGNSVSA
jgi:hypothetical protein